MFLSPNIYVIVYRIQPQEINMNENKRKKEEKTDHTMNPKKRKSDSIMDLVIQNHFKELKEEEDKIFQCRKGEFSNRKISRRHATSYFQRLGVVFTSWWNCF
jgi:hypothetical protein